MFTEEQIKAIIQENERLRKEMMHFRGKWHPWSNPFIGLGRRCSAV